MSPEDYMQKLYGNVQLYAADYGWKSRDFLLFSFLHVKLALSNPQFSSKMYICGSEIPQISCCRLWLRIRHGCAVR